MNDRNMSTDQRNVMVDKRNHHYVYNFVCEGCGSEGELMVHITECRSFNCPERCGAVYVQWFPPGKPATLRCVVTPIFERAS